LHSVDLAAAAMAIARGKLQNLIFDNSAPFSHRPMAGILGVMLKLTPVKQAMARPPDEVQIPEGPDQTDEQKTPMTKYRMIRFLWHWLHLQD
jgi:hypothetical protein